MKSKDYLSTEAIRLYVYDCLGVDEIASKLQVSTKTVYRWKEKYDWENRKRTYLKSKQSFHEELYEFARKIMKDISEDIDSGEKVDPGRFYAFCRLLPLFAKVKDYEDVVAHKEIKEEPKEKVLTPELVKRIEEEVLGITHNDGESEQ